MSISNDVHEIFNRLPEVFVPDKADNVDATIQIDLTGEGASAWLVRVANKNISVEEGRTESPDLTLQMAASDYVALTRGEINPMALFAAGKVKLQGDMALAMKFQQMFRRP